MTNRAALYVNPVYTTRFEGWSPAESQPLLDYLYRHATNENFTCRLRWARHTLAIWDNRCTMHNALNDYSGVRREMFRTSVKGSAPRAGLPLQDNADMAPPSSGISIDLGPMPSDIVGVSSCRGQ